METGDLQLSDTGSMGGGRGGPGEGSFPDGQTPAFPGGTEMPTLPGGDGQTPTFPGGDGQMPSPPGGDGQAPTFPGGESGGDRPQLPGGSGLSPSEGTASGAAQTWLLLVASVLILALGLLIAVKKK